MYDRKLLAKLSRCAWEVLSAYMKQGTCADGHPGAVIEGLSLKIWITGITVGFMYIAEMR